MDCYSFVSKRNCGFSIYCESLSQHEGENVKCEYHILLSNLLLHHDIFKLGVSLVK